MPLIGLDIFFLFLSHTTTYQVQVTRLAKNIPLEVLKKYHSIQNGCPGFWIAETYISPELLNSKSTDFQ
jgi:hypothetical protein